MLIAAFWVGGCASHAVIWDVDKMSSASAIKGDDVALIRLTPFDGNLDERQKLIFQGRGSAMTTESIWQRIFVGDREARGTITVTHSQIKEGAAAGGLEGDWTYSATAKLMIGTREFVLNATSSQTFVGRPFLAEKEAVEAGVLDIAHQAEKIMKQI